MNIPKVAIFDMDGLIFNTERQFFKFESMVHKKYGYPSRIEDFTQTLGLSFDSVKEVHKKIFGEDCWRKRFGNYERHSRIIGVF